MPQVPAILQPRLTLAYTFWSGVALYVAYCYLFGKQWFSTNLPRHTGPYGVGTVDIEAPSDRGQIGKSVFKSNGQPAFKLDSVLFSLYYPTLPNSKSTKPKHLWVPKPLALRAEGYAKVAHINNFLTNSFFTVGLWMIAGGNTISAEVDVPLLEKGYNTTSASDEFPVIVFSHGMASSRNDYTAYCGELASRGYVVAAIEHRDGSCPGSVVMNAEAGTERRVLAFHKKEVDRDPPLDDEDWKKEQLAMRQAEVEETIRVLRMLNDGDGQKVYLDNPRREGHDLSKWSSRLDMKRVIMGGHSFGATLALQALKGAPSTKLPLKGGIVLDPGKSSGPLNDEINDSILVIHSNSWSRKRSIFYGRPHFEVVKDLVLKALNHTGASWFMTSLQTSHPSVTDAPLIEPTLLSWTTGATIDVHQGLRQYVKVAHEYVQFMRTGERTGILASDVTHPSYDEDVRNEKAKHDADEDINKYWQIHVAPASG